MTFEQAYEPPRQAEASATGPAGHCCLEAKRLEGLGIQSLEALCKIWANYYWAITTHSKGVSKVFERTLKMTRNTVLNHIKRA